MRTADGPLASALAFYAWLDRDDPRLSGLSLTLERDWLLDRRRETSEIPVR
jgi:hypothetical protein